MIMCASSSRPPIKDASALLDMYELDTALNSTFSTTPTTTISDASALLDMYELVASYSAITGIVCGCRSTDGARDLSPLSHVDWR